MISLDISNFKYFNRMYGYREGDRLISRMVECFCHNNADCVLAYRIYVDHIIMLIEAEGLPEKVFKAKYSDMLSRFSEKTNMEFPLARIRLYLGAYYVEDRDEDIGIIIDKSQYARRSIKANYLTYIAIFRADMEKKAVDEAKIIPMFYSALENNRIEVYIQPKFSIDDERLIGGEALSRIMDNDGNIIPPGMYIDILERTHLISKLDGCVIRKLIAIQKKWMDEGRPLTTISLNLSRVDLLEQGFVDSIHQAIVESGVPSGYFEFELTETVFCENITEITKQIDFLKEKGYAVHCQYDGLHVLDFLNKEKIDLIILDIMLPYRSGDIILSDVRKKFTIPVIIISAKETTQNKIDLLRLGADDYITKPFDMEEVLARIESNLRRVQFQNSQTECLQYNNLSLDLEKNTAFLNGIELSLTAKEFGILELLMKYPDKVFSKSNLFQSVWDTEYIAEDNTLNVHISNLRNKLKAICSDTEFIDTVWGIGYRLHKAKD